MMFEQLAWNYLARRMKVHRKKGRHHQADHIRAAIATRVQKRCDLCCVFENTAWLDWATRFDTSFEMKKDAELYEKVSDFKSQL